jgi:signal transduction histidine kinase
MTVNDRLGRRRVAKLAWPLAAVSLALTLVSIATIGGDIYAGQGFAVVELALVLPALGALIASRRPDNSIGWILLGIGVTYAVMLTSVLYGEYGVEKHPGSLPLAAVLTWLGTWLWVPAFFALGLLLLLFPTGRLPSRRWRPVAAVMVAGLALTAASAAALTWPQRGLPLLRNQGTVEPKGWLGTVFFAGFLIAGVGAIASIWALVRRLRRARGEERQQMKWFTYAAALFIVSVALNLPPSLERFTNPIVYVTVLTIPGSIAIAVLKYRLYDIDVVINKTLVYFSLAGFITAVYVGIVVGIGALIGAGSSKPNLGLSILATAVVAVAFQPVRERIQRFANRLVYGRRATPYEVLSEFGHRMAGTYAAEDVLPRMARILAEGTGAKEARVWLGVSGKLTPAASWPDTGGSGSSARPDGADLVVPVTHQGEELGALTISKAPGERLTPAEEKLTRDLASQAGLVLRNVKLIEDLKASRVRLVQAQDEERRRIERNIHDGAQQQLVALQVKMGLAKRFTTDAAKLEDILSQLQGETNQALQDLRDLARGIYPPLLADQGLTAALEAQARKSSVPVTVQADGVGRYSQDAEAAVYFCCLEALQNVAKYAGATTAAVTLTASDGRLTFTVTDDGAGFDTSTTSYGTGLQGMADRLSALGGEVDVRSAPGDGTTVAGRQPVDLFEGASV